MPTVATGMVLLAAKGERAQIRAKGFFIVDETLCVHWDANRAIARKLVHHAPIEPIGECIEAERSGKRARKDVARID